jgi:tetratricopeptide (TPR) repeat protein
LALGRWKRSIQAYAITVPVARVTPQKASRLFFARAYALYGSKKYDEALVEARKARTYAIEEHDMRNADNLVQSIESYQAAVANYQQARQSQPDVPSAPGSANEDRPLLRKALEEPPREIVTRPVEATLEESVTFESFDCEERIFTLKTKDERVLRLYLEDPQKLEVRGTGTVTVDLTCGPQKHQQLQVSFFPFEDKQRKTVGLLRKVYFLGFYQ